MSDNGVLREHMGSMSFLASAAEVAIEMTNLGRPDYVVTLPNGVLAKAGAIVRDLKLEGFLKPN